jgi:hypothetical protein
MKMNQMAEEALDAVQIKQAALKIAKEEFEQELERELQRKLEPFIKDRDLAVKRADEVGVPRTQIGRTLGTTNYKTIQDILEQFGIAPRTQAGTIPNKPWSCLSTPDGWKLTITKLGPAGLTGSAIVKLDDDGQLERVDGDYFVVGAIYTNGFSEEVIQCLKAN